MNMIHNIVLYEINVHKQVSALLSVSWYHFSQVSQIGWSAKQQNQITVMALWCLYLLIRAQVIYDLFLIDILSEFKPDC